MICQCQGNVLEECCSRESDRPENVRRLDLPVPQWIKTFVVMSKRDKSGLTFDDQIIVALIEVATRPST